VARSIDIACITLVLAPSLLTTTQKVFQVTSPAYVLVITLLRLIACSATNACCYLACAVNSLFFWHYVIRPTWHLFRNFVEQEWLKSYSSSIQKLENKLFYFHGDTVIRKSYSLSLTWLALPEGTDEWRNTACYVGVVKKRLNPENDLRCLHYL